MSYIAQFACLSVISMFHGRLPAGHRSLFKKHWRLVTGLPLKRAISGLLYSPHCLDSTRCSLFAHCRMCLTSNKQKKLVACPDILLVAAPITSIHKLEPHFKHPASHLTTLASIEHSSVSACSRPWFRALQSTCRLPVDRAVRSIGYIYLVHQEQVY